MTYVKPVLTRKGATEGEQIPLPSRFGTEQHLVASFRYIFTVQGDLSGFDTGNCSIHLAFLTDVIIRIEKALSNSIHNMYFNFLLVIQLDQPLFSFPPNISVSSR